MGALDDRAGTTAKRWLLAALRATLRGPAARARAREREARDPLLNRGSHRSTARGTAAGPVEEPP